MSADQRDLAGIYAEHYPRIVGYLGRLVGEADAEDVAQETFVKVSRSLDSFRGESLLSTWIYRIATNTAMDHLRKPSARRTIQQHHDAGDDDMVLDEHPAAVGSATEHGDRSETRPILLHSLFPVQPFLAMHGNLVFSDEILKYLLRHVRLENPHGALLAVDGCGALSPIAVFFALLPFPGFRHGRLDGRPRPPAASAHPGWRSDRLGPRAAGTARDTARRYSRW